MRRVNHICGLFAALAVLTLAACKEEEKAAAGAPPPQPVSIVVVGPEPIPVIADLPGRIAPTRISEVRARVSGIVISRDFEQGAHVEAGDPLYHIDPDPFRVQVERAEAALQSAEALQVAAQQLADRQVELLERRVVSAQTVDDAVANLNSANANVAVAQAELAAAQIDLEHAVVKAPISGRIGRARITEGALVSPSDAESLATIQQLDPVYADFTQPSKERLALRRANEAGQLDRTPEGDAAVRLLLDDGSSYPDMGRLLFSEATVDELTGQVTMRAEFPNPHDDLLPGLYVRVLIQQGVQENAIAVPQQAVQRDAGGGARVYVVDEEGKARLQPITTGRVDGSRWVVESGLTGGERVIVEGFQKIRPGQQVDPKPWKEGAARGVSEAGDEEPAAERKKG